jgi:two-component system, LytTR family, response regulator LytT
MKYLIVEDERFAYEELKRMMTALRPDYVLEQRTKTVIETIAFLKAFSVDLILMDIRLADGNCFEIFNHVAVTTPVIFTTAYDEHAIKAFKLNSIDYLLKPFDEKELEAALHKFEQLFQSHIIPQNLEQLLAVKTKNRFLISKGDNYHYIETTDIAHFYSEEKVVFLHTFQHKRHIINYTLDQLEQQLDKRLFFRVSRNCIGQVKAIENVSKHFNSRLKLTFAPACPHEVLVSRVRVPDFLKWMDGII